MSEEEKVEFEPVYFVVKRKSDKETLFFVPVLKEKYPDVLDGGVFQLISELYAMERLSKSQFTTFMAMKVAPAFEPNELAAIVVSDEDTKYYVSEKK